MSYISPRTRWNGSLTPSGPGGPSFVRTRVWRFGRLAAAVASLVLVAACTSAGASPKPAATVKPGAVAPSAAASAAAPSAATSAAAPSAAATACPTSPPPALPAGETRTVTMNTAAGTIVIKVEGALAPRAAGNFVALSSCGYYNGTVFHRLVPGFVIQGGDGEFGRTPNVDTARVGQGGPGYEFKDDPVNGSYTRGTVAMANSGPNTNGSQFFIVLANVSLDPNYSIFGNVTSGMEVVDKIAAMPNSGPPANQALKPVAITTVSVANP